MYESKRRRHRSKIFISRFCANDQFFFYRLQYFSVLIIYVCPTVTGWLIRRAIHSPKHYKYVLKCSPICPITIVRAVFTNATNGRYASV